MDHFKCPLTPSPADTLNITVNISQYTLGGSISGLTGTVYLQNNGINPQPFNSNGSFNFATPVAEGSAYDVTVATQPFGQTCIVTNGSGTMGGGDVTNIDVSCTTNTTTLATSLSNLALKTSGNSRTITITNIGSSIAKNLSISYPIWPIGTTTNSDCGSFLDPMDTCTITVNPGANATSSCDSPYIAPTPGIITVNASNVTASATTDVYVLTYGCIYQQGYIFAIDDTTPTSTSIGGTTAALIDISSAIQWYNGTPYVITNAQSLTDGATNTATIISVQGDGIYAAESCANYIVDSSGNSPCLTGTCYRNWYLPAICQMGGTGEDVECPSGISSMVSNLPNLISGCTGSGCLADNYWSSTEYLYSPQFFAFSENFSSSVSTYADYDKNNTFAVRCSRNLTP